MEKDYSTLIANLLSEQERLAPLKTGERPKLNSIGTIRAMVFDIYGTLLISSSGDVDEAEMSARYLKEAFSFGGYQIISNQEEKWQELLQSLVSEIKHNLYSLRNEQTPYPEIDIRKIWQKIISMALEMGLIKMTDKSQPDKAIIAFEIRSNQVSPMPGMLEVINYLAKKQIPLGIVSNAQFYTLHLMNYFLGSDRGEQQVAFFDHDISIFSYHYGKGKPDSFLFEILTKKIAEKYQIAPEETLFLGNDMLKDIAAAKKAGLQTALFAGDKRSLKWRTESIRDLKPDLIITDLLQLKKIL
jgi:putative hydrolase of the HAD superfamily